MPSFWVFVVRLIRKARQHRLLGMLLVFLLVGICILGNAICFYFYEREPKPNLTFEDALWFSAISITTIGYGDLTAETLGARLGTVAFIMIMGLATFSLFLGMLVDWVTEVTLREQYGMSEILANNHLLLVHFPSRERVEQILRELKSDPEYRDREIVLITDHAEIVPIRDTNLLFVKGSPLDQATYRRARIDTAYKAIVLATSYTEPSNDALVASAVAVIHSLAPEMHVIAECMDSKHQVLFSGNPHNVLVLTLELAGNLLVQEAQDPGVARLVDFITKNHTGPTLYSTLVEHGKPAPTYAILAKAWVDHAITLMSVDRAAEPHTHFKDMSPEPGDRVMYLAEKRMTWSQMLACLRRDLHGGH